MKKLFQIGTVLALVAATSGVMAQPPGGGQGKGNRPDMSSIDTNGDGQISQDEFSAFSKARREQGGAGGQGAGKGDRRFGRLDSNSDGVISQEELAARPRRDGQGGGRREGGFGGRRGDGNGGAGGGRGPGGASGPRRQ